MLKYYRNQEASISAVDSMQIKIQVCVFLFVRFFSSQLCVCVSLLMLPTYEQPAPVIRVMYGIMVTVMLPLKELWLDQYFFCLRL